MINIIRAMVEAQEAEYHILYSLLFFLHGADSDLGDIDVKTQLVFFDPDILVLAVAFFELHQGIDVPDSYLMDMENTLKQLAEQIRLLPKLTDAAFQRKVMMDKASRRAVLNRN